MAMCYRCYGAKKVLGVGMIEVDCPECNGTGKTDKPHIYVAAQQPERLANEVSNLDISSNSDKTKKYL